MADTDKAKQNQLALTQFDVGATKNEAQRHSANYAMADAQNAALRDVQLAQIGRKGETDRFEAQRALQNAALGLFGNLGTAGFGSTVGNLMRMLRSRNDSDNNTYWQQLADNQNQVLNAYDESLNQNRVSENDMWAGAEKAVKDIESQYAANMWNLDQDADVTPGQGEGQFAAHKLYNDNAKQPNYAKLAGYLTPQDYANEIRKRRQPASAYDFYDAYIRGR